ncbi:MAG: peptidoglycan DD-metalloendopeptidase family protein [Bacteroidota bacterium]
MNKNTRLFPSSLQNLSIFLAGVILLLSASCNQNTTSGALSPLAQTPREAYWSALDSMGLAKTQIAKTWQLAETRALRDGILVEAPFQETGYFRSDVPAALAYRLKLKTGELLQIKLSTEPDSTLFFVDFFRIEPTDSIPYFQHLFNAENYQTDSLAYEVHKNGTYLLRIQPELLASCRYNLQLIAQPIYSTFPVSGKGNQDIWSFFGDPRDGGKRKHKGIDIFARRGTPLVAATDGEIRRVKNGGLGGKQIWLYDSHRRQSLYYAHLDSQMVKENQRVKAGDTLGTVGNTGNARNTRPHLHFSVYKRRQGAVDPFPFVAYQKQKAPSVRADTSRLGQIARVRRQDTSLKAAPQNRSATIATLNRHLPLQIIAASSYWYRVRSPDGISGYLHTKSLEGINRSIGTITLTEATELLQSPDSKASPVSSVQPNEEVAVVGKNESYQLIRDQDGEIGWMPIRAR